ncbi:hypothetical protein DBR06_SOUSAS23910004 [Sousa chinensis]|nr:hypothetical protein DBR06_SOUSAS23910004 [Sousa chinensis]
MSPHVPTLSDSPIVNRCDWSVFQVIFLVALAIFGTQSHGYEVYNIISPTDNDGPIQETMTIDNEKNTAVINIHAGSCSSTTIFDYKHGYIASRVLSRRACYILKMNHKAIPALDQLQRYIFEGQALNNMFSDKYIWVKYNPLQSLITDMILVLKAVQRLGSWASWEFPSVQTFTFKASAHWFHLFREIHVSTQRPN